MELPEALLCDRCGADARVIDRVIDDEALAGRIPSNDPRWVDGFWVSFVCPNCGDIRQSISPPPAGPPPTNT